MVPSSKGFSTNDHLHKSVVERTSKCRFFPWEDQEDGQGLFLDVDSGEGLQTKKFTFSKHRRNTFWFFWEQIDIDEKYLFSLFLFDHFSWQRAMVFFIPFEGLDHPSCCQRQSNDIKFMFSMISGFHEVQSLLGLPSFAHSRHSHFFSGQALSKAGMVMNTGQLWAIRIDKPWGMWTPGSLNWVLK